MLISFAQKIIAKRFSARYLLLQHRLIVWCMYMYVCMYALTTLTIHVQFVPEVHTVHVYPILLNPSSLSHDQILWITVIRPHKLELLVTSSHTSFC